ncbi:MAG: hypothetical protein DWB42_15390 [Chloroflexi bacterium]|nr:hypothetical protein [Chloroflexota bacterium]MDL1883409.1 hypothetical protein [Anaerolineae bacterium CFX8]
MAYEDLLERVEERSVRRQRRAGKRAYALAEYEDLYDEAALYEPRRSKRRSMDDEDFEDERRSRRRESWRSRRRLWKD